MASTKIEWCDKVWNPISGCSKVSQGCKNCYAETYARRFWGDRKFSDVRFHSERLEQPLHWKKPCRIFVNSMSDLFHPDVETEWIDSIIEAMEACERHTFIVLTKRPELIDEKLYGVTEENPLRALGGGDYVGNLWLGVSVENQETADERIPELLKIPAAVRWMSYEPALGPVDFEPYLQYPPFHENYKMTFDETEWGGLDWVVAGGESGPGARPAHPDWFRSARDQCQAAGVPFFFKQWGEWLPMMDNGPLPDYANYIGIDGTVRVGDFESESDWCMGRRGKKKAGRELDGREWNEFPKEDNGR